jgi:hypothetical protein
MTVHAYRGGVSNVPAGVQRLQVGNQNIRQGGKRRWKVTNVNNAIKERMLLLLTLLFGLSENTTSECTFLLFRRLCIKSFVARKTAASTWFMDII